jgi:hypothetical protein
MQVCNEENLREGGAVPDEPACRRSDDGCTVGSLAEAAP